jgi:hypothetical protein
VSAGFANRCPWWSYQVARIRLIVGLITPHRIYLTIMKPVREAKARSRAMYVCSFIVTNKTLLQDRMKRINTLRTDSLSKQFIDYNAEQMRLVVFC